MVFAAVGPLLVPYVPSGQLRRTLLFACAAMFGLSLLATLLMLPVIFARLLTAGPLPLPLTPTLFLVLGPLGQSTTAVGTITDAAHGGSGLVALYGVPVMGFALLWCGLATALVLRARRHGMGFAMTWWAFTFPVGTCVTGAEAPGPAHRPRRLRLARDRSVRRPGRRLGPRRRADGARSAQRNTARRASPSTRGASASDGPYQVRCRPLTSAQGSGSKASGPSSAVKR